MHWAEGDATLVSKAEESYSITSQTLSSQAGGQAVRPCLFPQPFVYAGCHGDQQLFFFFLLKLARPAQLWRADWSQVNHTVEATQQVRRMMLETAARPGKGGQQTSAKITDTGRKQTRTSDDGDRLNHYSRQHTIRYTSGCPYSQTTANHCTQCKDPEHKERAKERDVWPYQSLCICNNLY